MVSYSKPYLTFEQQVDKLEERGIQLDRATALHAVERIGYYRLSGYWYPYRQIDVDASLTAGRAVRRNEVVDGTTFDQVLRLYDFDRRLKLLMIDALERIEVAVRVELAYVLGRAGTFAHHDPACLDRRFTKPRPSRPDTRSRHDEWLSKFDVHLGRSSEDFVQHFVEKYDGQLPVWVAIEVLDFGSMSMLFEGCRRPDRDAIAARFGVHDHDGAPSGSTLGNWLRMLNLARNTCAHHARLWNRNFVDQVRESALRPIAPLAHIAELEPRSRARVYPAIAISNYLMKQVAPDATWTARTRDLLTGFPHDAVVSLADMGVPDEWATHLV